MESTGRKILIMKKRIQFVSNSSSSSFCITLKKKEPCKCCGKEQDDFINLINAAKDSDTYINEISNIDKAIEAWSTMEIGWQLDQLKKAKSLGFEYMVTFCLSDHDYEIQKYLSEEEGKSLLSIY